MPVVSHAAASTTYQFQFAAHSSIGIAADFNGNGLPDVVVINTAANTLSFLLSGNSLIQPSLALTSSATSALAGSAVTLKASVGSGPIAATGVVSLLDGGTQIAQQPLDSTGSAGFTLSSLSAAVHTLTLAYAGDSHYAAGTSAPLTESITDFQLTTGPASQTVAAGSPASYTLTVTGVAGFTGSVSFACSALPTLATCNAPSVTLTSSAATATLIVSTAAATTARNLRYRAIAEACLLIGCFWLGGRKQTLLRLREPGRLLFPLLLLLVMDGLTACGGSSQHTEPGTPDGTSTITVTASTTQNGVTVTHSSTATLNVQN